MTLVGPKKMVRPLTFCEKTLPVIENGFPLTEKFAEKFSVVAAAPEATTGSAPHGPKIQPPFTSTLAAEAGIAAARRNAAVKKAERKRPVLSSPTQPSTENAARRVQPYLKW